MRAPRRPLGIEEGLRRFLSSLTGGTDAEPSEKSYAESAKYCSGAKTPEKKGDLRIQDRRFQSNSRWAVLFSRVDGLRGVVYSR